MSDTSRYNELFKKVAALERRISKLELGVKEIDTVIDPQGWIGEAFDKVDEDLTELRDEMNQRFEQLDGKIDIILRHLTGISDEQD